MRNRDAIIDKRLATFDLYSPTHDHFCVVMPVEGVVVGCKEWLAVDKLDALVTNFYYTLGIRANRLMVGREPARDIREWIAKNRYPDKAFTLEEGLLVGVGGKGEFADAVAELAEKWYAAPAGSSQQAQIVKEAVATQLDMSRSLAQRQAAKMLLLTSVESETPELLKEMTEAVQKEQIFRT